MVDAGENIDLRSRLQLYLVTDERKDTDHVGQEDIDCRDVRRLLPTQFVGVSVTSVEEAIQAEQSGADYVGVGSLFQTSSKPDATYCQLADLSSIQKHINIPIVGIGGITEDIAQDIIRAGAAGIAVMSAITAADNRRERAARLKAVVKSSIDRRTPS